MMMAPHKPRKHRKPGKYRPLLAYYQETRAAFPRSLISRSAAYLNNNAVADSWACNCQNQPAVWRYLSVPNDRETPAPQSIRQLQKTKYPNTEVVLRGFGWKNPPQSTTTPLIGLFLPSAKGPTLIRERDFFHDLEEHYKDAREDVTLLGKRLDTIHKRFARQDAPDAENVKQMVFNGIETTYSNNSDASKTRPCTPKDFKNNDCKNKDAFKVFEDLEFRWGSCLRWPYGQVPRLGLTDFDRAMLYPDATKTSYGLEASIAYCETISPKKDGSSVGFDPGPRQKLQACHADPLTPRQRHDFCKSHEWSALHLVYGLQIEESRRKLEHICSEEHQVCLVVPGVHKHGTLSTVLHEHFKAHRDHPETGTGYTFLVTPFNASVFKILLGNRHSVKVAQGIDFQYASESNPINTFTPLDPHDSNKTGIMAHTDLFDMLNNLNHSVDDIKAAIDAFVEDLTNKTSGCPRGEVRIPARSEHLWEATECVLPESLFKGAREADAVIRFDNTIIESASTTYPLRFQQMERPDKQCVRLEIYGANNVTVGHTVADQSGCHTPATAMVIRSGARFLSLQGLSVVGDNVASALTVLTAAQGETTDVTGSQLNISFATAPRADVEHGFFRAAVAASGAVGDANTTLNLAYSSANEGNVVVLLPAPNSNGLTVAPGDGSKGPLKIIDLTNSIAEFAHGTLKKLYSTDAVSRPAWTTTVVFTIVLGTFTAFLVGSAIFKDIKASR